MGRQRLWENGNLIYELEKGKGKVKEYFEYNCDLLYYEGEYLNGKKNGYGKEFSENGKYLS